MNLNSRRKPKIVGPFCCTFSPALLHLWLWRWHSFVSQMGRTKAETIRPCSFLGWTLSAYLFGVSDWWLQIPDAPLTNLYIPLSALPPVSILRRTACHSSFDQTHQHIFISMHPSTKNTKTSPDRTAIHLNVCCSRLINATKSNALW